VIMGQYVVICEVCGLNAVTPVREEANGIEVWRCSRCGDMKRWCQRCDQGWIRRERLPGLFTEFYSCDECDATYVPLEHDMAETFTREGWVDLQTFLNQHLPNWSWADIVVMRETEAV